MPARQVLWSHVGVLLVLSIGFESLFVAHGLNPLDEGWPLYAAMQMHAGGTLYGDVFFVFPPGHVLSAWLAYAWDPPGVLLARTFYAGFNVALCLAIYALGRRIAPPLAAFVGAALLAIGAAHSHGAHFLFGYRYLVFSVLALWCFAERVRTNDRRWMFAAGLLAGVAIVFRLTPAFAAIAGVGAGVVIVDRTLRDVWRDTWRFALGFSVAVVPVAAWFAADVGWSTLWSEAVVRPLVMTREQSLPIPALQLPSEWNRWRLRESFYLLEFRLFTFLHLGYGVAMAALVWRALRRGQRFEFPVLLAVVVWGGVYFSRAFGRADEAHLDSTLPAACLLIGHAWGLLLRRELGEGVSGGGVQREAWVAAIGTLSAWAWLTNVDLYARHPYVRGIHPVHSLEGRTSITADTRYRAFDGVVHAIQLGTRRDDIILDLTASSLLHVVSGRHGPGGSDIIMPGTFETEAAERAFLARLDARPPALVVMPSWDFDDLPERGLAAESPLLLAWVEERFERYQSEAEFILLRPKTPQNQSR